MTDHRVAPASLAAGNGVDRARGQAEILQRDVVAGVVDQKRVDPVQTGAESGFRQHGRDAEAFVVTDVSLDGGGDHAVQRDGDVAVVRKAPTVEDALDQRRDFRQFGGYVIPGPGVVELDGRLAVPGS